MVIRGATVLFLDSFTLESGEVRAVDTESSCGIVWGYWAVADAVVFEDVMEILFGRPPNLTVQLSCFVCSFNFATGV